jgi:hypothetical protein
MADERAVGTSGLGIAALVLGIVALLGCWIPLIGILTIPIAGLGLVLAFLGLLISALGRKSSIGMPFAGIVTCGLAIMVAMSMTAGLVKTVADAAAERSRTKQQESWPTANPLGSKPAGSTIPPGGAPAANPNGFAGPSPGATPPDWTVAGKPVTQGDVEVTVNGVEVVKVPISEALGGVGQSAEPQLIVRLTIRNRSNVKKLDFRGWGGRAFAFGGDFATIADDHGNTYKRIYFGALNKPVGQVSDNESIYPGKSLGDVLVFEPPIDAAGYLTLELPAAAFGGEGMLRFRIPGDMLRPAPVKPIATDPASKPAAPVTEQKTNTTPNDDRPSKPTASAAVVDPTPEQTPDDKKWRTWKSGTHTLDAKFDGMSDRVVKLKKRDGSFVKVPLERLSPDDQAFILKRKWAE